MNTQEQPRPIIIAERGGDWARCADKFRCDDVVVLVQQPDEKLRAFNQRALSRVTDLSLSDDRAIHAVVVGGGRVDPTALSERSTLVRKLAGLLSNHGGLVRLEDAGPDRYSMAAIAATISMLTRGTRVRVEHPSVPAAA